MQKVPKKKNGTAIIFAQQFVCFEKEIWRVQPNEAVTYSRDKLAVFWPKTNEFGQQWVVEAASDLDGISRKLSWLIRYVRSDILRNLEC